MKLIKTILLSMMLIAAAGCVEVPVEDGYSGSGYYAPSPVYGSVGIEVNEGGHYGHHHGHWHP